MTTTQQALTDTQMSQALAVIADYLGDWKPCPVHEDDPKWVLHCDHPVRVPAPTGAHAAAHALGPELNPTWDWPSSGPTPTILLEGGPYDWAVDASLDPKVIAAMASFGVFCEPYAGYALCLYPN